jgi:hypothetical protein
LEESAGGALGIRGHFFERFAAQFGDFFGGELRVGGFAGFAA